MRYDKSYFFLISLMFLLVSRDDDAHCRKDNALFFELGFEPSVKRRAPVEEHLVVNVLTTTIVANSTG